MPLRDIPTSAASVVDALREDVKARAPTSNPWLRGSWLNAVVVALGERAFDMYYALRRASEEAMPDTARLNLNRWAAIYGVSQLAAAYAEGMAWIEAEASGLTIPDATVLVDEYDVPWQVVGNHDLDGHEMQYSSSVAIVGVDPYYVNGIPLLGQVFPGVLENPATIEGTLVRTSGWDPANYEIPVGQSVVPALVTDQVNIAWECEGPSASIVTPGALLIGKGPTIAGLYTWGKSVHVRCTVAGSAYNRARLDRLTFQTPIANVRPDAKFNYLGPPPFVDGGWYSTGGAQGGADGETRPVFRSRFLSSVRNPPTEFNANRLKQLAEATPGVTSAVVEEAATAGDQISVYLVNDNADSNTRIPDSATRDEVEAALHAITPAHYPTEYVNVVSVTEITASFVLSGLDPATDTMKESIRAAMWEYLFSFVGVGVAPTEDDWRGVIANTLDLTTGQRLQAFTLSHTPPSPSASQAVVLDITFS